MRIRGKGILAMSDYTPPFDVDWLAVEFLSPSFPDGFVMSTFDDEDGKAVTNCYLVFDKKLIYVGAVVGMRQLDVGDVIERYFDIQVSHDKVQLVEMDPKDHT